MEGFIDQTKDFVQQVAALREAQIAFEKIFALHGQEDNMDRHRARQRVIALQHHVDALLNAYLKPTPPPSEDDFLF